MMFNVEDCTSYFVVEDTLYFNWITFLVCAILLNRLLRFLHVGIPVYPTEDTV